MVVYTNLPKCQAIEKIDLIQSKATDFESKKKSKEVLAIGIVTIGRAFAPETVESHKEKARSNGITAEAVEARDGSQYYAYYVLTRNKEPMNFTEYACRLASGSSTHVIQLSDCSSSSSTASMFDYDPDWKTEFHEVVFTERSGRQRHSFVAAKGCLDQVY